MAFWPEGASKREQAIRSAEVYLGYHQDIGIGRALLLQIATALLDENGGAHDVCLEAFGAHELAEMRTVARFLHYLRSGKQQPAIPSS